MVARGVEFFVGDKAPIKNVPPLKVDWVNAMRESMTWNFNNKFMNPTQEIDRSKWVRDERMWNSGHGFGKRFGEALNEIK